MSPIGSKTIIFVTFAALCAGAVSLRAAVAQPLPTAADPQNVGNGKIDSRPAGDADQENTQKPGGDQELSPAQKMEARFPQPARVGHLIGLPVLDWNDSTIGYVQQVTKTTDGKIRLIVPYAKWFGWARNGSALAGGRRPVAVPIEVVAILAQQIDVLDMDRTAFDKAPTWVEGTDQTLPANEIIRIATARR